MSIGDIVKDVYGGEARRMKYEGMFLKLPFHNEASILHCFRQVCKSMKIQSMGVVYDEKTERVYVREDCYLRTWKKLTPRDAVARVASAIKQHYLDTYEMYLILKCKSKVTEQAWSALKAYYEYAVALGAENVEADVSDFVELFWETHKNMSMEEKNRIIGLVASKIIESSKVNLEEMRQQVAEVALKDKKLRAMLSL